MNLTINSNRNHLTMGYSQFSVIEEILRLCQPYKVENEI